MIEPRDTRQPIVNDTLCSTTQEVIQLVRSNTLYPFLLDAKFGDAENGPMPDTDTALNHDTPLVSIGGKWARIMSTLAQTDQQHGNPLAQIAQRANDVMAQAAIVNRHKRRPPLYSESTLRTLIELDFVAPDHSRLIRAAGHLFPPPIIPPSHGINSIIADIAAHMARSHEPQRPAQVFESLHRRQDTLANWPQLDLPLFIRRVADIRPDEQGFYHSDQPWGNFISAQRLVASTMLRIFARDQQPCTIQFLTTEIQRLVGQFLPNGYNTVNAIRNFASTSDAVSWQGLSTFGLKEWENALNPQNMALHRGRTGDLIYAFLMQHGPADIDDVIEHFQQTTNAKKRTVQESINHDPKDRFIRIYDQRVAANPIPKGHNPGVPSLMGVPDAHRPQPPSVLQESEIFWLTRYVQALNDLTPPLPERVAVTGRRAAGFAQGDPLAITVVVDPSHRPSLEPRLAKIAAATSRLVPSVRPNIIILSPQQWANQQAAEAHEAHHNAWLATNTTP